jgi:hypothetical protein
MLGLRWSRLGASLAVAVSVAVTAACAVPKVARGF